MINPFDLRAAISAKHAQHVALVHFPIALFLSAVAFDLLARWKKARVLAEVAYYNLIGAAITTVPVLVTGILAWRFQLDGQRIHGILLLHIIFACLASVLIWVALWAHRGARRADYLPGYILLFECGVTVIVMVTGHLGGFLSGVNSAG